MTALELFKARATRIRGLVKTIKPADTSKVKLPLTKAKQNSSSTVSV